MFLILFIFKFRLEINNLKSNLFQYYAIYNQQQLAQLAPPPTPPP